MNTLFTSRKKRPWLSGALCAAVFSFITATTNAALIDNGDGLIYDDVLKITWAQPDVRRTWDNANTWAAGLTLGGVSGWRLPYISVAAGAGPTVSPVDCNTATEAACQDNELGYMFYHNLSGTAGQSILTSGDPDLAFFPTLQSSAYWSGTDANSSVAWVFLFSSGGSGVGSKSNSSYSWAVHAGNVGGTVQVPIDIKPGSDPNCFNINGHGVIPVAILGTEDFDVTEIDLASLSFGGLAVRVRGNKGALCSVEYSNSDEYLDLVCHFEDDSTNWTPGDGEATLTGSLIDGTAIEGSDSICVVP